MIYNIDFDIAALFFIIAILSIFYYKKWIPSIQNKVFSSLLWVSLFSTVTDIIETIMASYPELFPAWLHMLILYAYFILIDALPILYAFYIVTLTGVEGKFLVGIRKAIFYVPMVFAMVLIVTNPMTEWIFYFDPATDNFLRNYGVEFLNLVAFYYLLFGALKVIKHRRILGRDKSVALCLFVLFITVPVVIQMTMPTVFITMLGVAICLFFILVTIQGSEEIISSTGLLNRSAFMSTVAIYNEKAEEFSVAAVHIKDYRYFKRVFGRLRMRKFLFEMAYNLSGQFSKRYLYYVGTGRFVILYSEVRDRTAEIERLQQIFNREISVDHFKLQFKVNLCFVHYPKDVDNLDDLLEMIDSYDAFVTDDKQVFFGEEIELFKSKRVDEIEQAIEKAIREDKFEVYYQPIYSTQLKKYNSAEALIRWNDENLGQIAPSEFIPISEKDGTIIRVGMIVLRKVCQFYSENRLKEKGIDYIEINISVAQCMQKDLVDQILSVINEYGIDPTCINLEITESVAAGSPETLQKMMNNLKLSGVNFSLDDYGTGFSSMASLIDLPFSLVKLDREVISRLDHEKTQIAIENTILMLKRMQFKIVAEGVETEREVELLTSLECDYLQGYYYSRPLEGNAFLAHIQEKTK